MSKDDSQKRIDDFLLGRANEASRKEMNEEISRNAELSNQLADTQLAMDAIELAEDQALKARLQGLEANFQAAAPNMVAESTAVVKDLPAPGLKKASVRPRRNLRRLYGIAAAVLVLLLAGWFILRPGGSGYDSPQALAMDTFEAYENITPGGVRGGADDPVAQAYAAYDAGKFAEAAAALRTLPPTAVNKFYFGQSLLATQEYAGAAVQFEDLRKTDFGLNRESEYYLALARLGEGKQEIAREMLLEISATGNHPLLKEASELLEKLEALD